MKSIWFGNKVANVKNIEPRNFTFESFVNHLKSSVERIPETVEEYHALQKMERAVIKDGRYFCSSTFISPSRRDTNCALIQIVCIDVDDPAHVQYLQPDYLTGALEGFSWCVYSTLSSKPDAKRYRLIVDADGAIPSNYYPRAVASISQLINLPHTTTESFTLSQPMYTPKACADADFEFYSSLDGDTFKESNIDFNLDVGGGRMTLDDAGDLGGLEFLERPLDITREEAEEALTFLPADCGLKEWVRTAGSIKHQFQNDDEEGFQVFHTWSRRATDKYVSESDCAKTWKTLKANPNKKPSTFGTVFYLAAENGWKRESINDSEYGEILSLIDKGGDHVQLTKSIPDKIRQVAFSAGDFELLVGLLQKKIKEALNTAMPIAVLRKMCKYDRSADIYETEDGVLVDGKAEIMAWTDGFVYLTSTGEYFNKNACESYKPTVVDSMYRKFMKVASKDGTLKTIGRASDYLDSEAQVPIVRGCLYHPGKAKEFKFHGGTYVNVYQDFSPKGKPDALILKETTRILDNHFNLLLTGHDRDNVKYFLAMIIQNPGVKLRWSILLQGHYGNGKSFLAQLMGKAMGGHVNSVDASKLKGQFNPFATGSRLCVLEEMRLNRNESDEIMEKLKTMVANETVTIERKNRDVVEVPNVTNYLMLTNSRTSLQINEGDRRYYLVKTRQQNEGHVFRDMPEEYFNELFKALGSPAACRQYFENIKIPDSFNINKMPKADQQVRDMFIETSKSDIQLAVEEILKEGMTQRLIVSSTTIFTTIRQDMEGRFGSLKISNSSVSRVLINLNFTKLPNRVGISGTMHTLWYDPDHVKVNDTSAPVILSLYNELNELHDL